MILVIFLMSRSKLTNQQRWQEVSDLFDFKVYLDADLEDR